MKKVTSLSKSGSERERVRESGSERGKKREEKIIITKNEYYYSVLSAAAVTELSFVLCQRRAVVTHPGSADSSQASRLRAQTLHPYTSSAVRNE